MEGQTRFKSRKAWNDKNKKLRIWAQRKLQKSVKTGYKPLLNGKSRN